MNPGDGLVPQYAPRVIECACYWRFNTRHPDAWCGSFVKSHVGVTERNTWQYCDPCYEDDCDHCYETVGKGKIVTHK